MKKLSALFAFSAIFLNQIISGIVFCSIRAIPLICESSPNKSDQAVPNCLNLTRNTHNP